MVKKQSQNYYKLSPKDISISVDQSKNENIILTISLYKRSGWKQHIKIELVDFPDCCSSIDNFKSLTIRGVQRSVRFKLTLYWIAAATLTATVTFLWRHQNGYL